jgi:hypothetical protein
VPVSSHRSQNHTLRQYRTWLEGSSLRGFRIDCCVTLLRLELEDEYEYEDENEYEHEDEDEDEKPSSLRPWHHLGMSQ